MSRRKTAQLLLWVCLVLSTLDVASIFYWGTDFQIFNYHVSVVRNAMLIVAVILLSKEDEG